MSGAHRNSPSHDVFEHRVDMHDVSWYVEEAGSGPTLLLLHGTGSSVHTWRTLRPHLLDDYRVLALDLPGHGRSTLHRDSALSLDGMARGAADVMVRLRADPAAVIGHSAGAAVAVQMMLDAPERAVPVVSLNGAFVPFGGLLGQWFSPLARSLAGSDFVARMIAGRASNPGAVERLMRSTGSVIDETFLDDYQALFSSPAHVHATLGMMARWDLWSLQERLGELASPLTLFYGERDMTVPPHQARLTAARVPHGEARSLGALGHLAHEEAASDVAGPLRDALCASAMPHT